jgi:hypothetical protein
VCPGTTPYSTLAAPGVGTDLVVIAADSKEGGEDIHEPTVFPYPSFSDPRAPTGTLNLPPQPAPTPIAPRTRSQWPFSIQWLTHPEALAKINIPDTNVATIFCITATIFIV